MKQGSGMHDWDKMGVKEKLNIFAVQANANQHKVSYYKFARR